MFSRVLLSKRGRWLLCELLILCSGPASFLVRVAAWTRPIKAWRCSWWPLANRTCRRFCSDPSPRTRKLLSLSNGRTHRPPPPFTNGPPLGLFINHTHMHFVQMCLCYSFTRPVLASDRVPKFSSCCWTKGVGDECIWFVFNDPHWKTHRISCNTHKSSSRPGPGVTEVTRAVLLEEPTMNCPFSVIMVPVLCPSQVQYYDNWRLAVPSQYAPDRRRDRSHLVCLRMFSFTGVFCGVTDRLESKCVTAKCLISEYG